MNKVVLMGRLTRDPDVRYTQGQDQKCIARYTLAVDRRKARDSEGQQADFISCVAFGKAGEFIEKYCHKGTKLVVSGRIQTGSYTNRDGQKVYTTDVVAEDQEFAESKSAAGNGTGEAVRTDAAAGASGENQSNSEAAGDGFMSIPDGIDEELPFN
jgi:single-strand DNA-binding protein